MISNRFLVILIQSGCVTFAEEQGTASLFYEVMELHTVDEDSLLFYDSSS